ncbi:hypothetical protein BDY19DRAFT_996615 [Irpex rosettiformis]|uniref:Uncharacterized protein n=1 Tax=Irpex rosettiformis TaxID=378272 RepID=A0ACB8TUK3_9APHY|nr:hypothetical protein BDY19DRAFT_996615 [Irpex rosettiformis]
MGRYLRSQGLRYQGQGKAKDRRLAEKDERLVEKDKQFATLLAAKDERLAEQDKKLAKNALWLNMLLIELMGEKNEAIVKFR